MPMSKEEELIHGLMNDVTGGDITYDKDELQETIQSILKKYNLSTDMSFIEKVATMKFPNSNEKISSDMFPKELQDAAFLPVSTIADIALRQDLELIVSQIPEWYIALQITRDAICEADIVDGTLSRNIIFDRTKLQETEEQAVIDKIETVEDRLKLHSIIKNHIVYNTLFYGEGYVYVVPYAKVFEDLYKYRLANTSKKDPRNAVASMFENSSSLTGYGYGYSETHQVEKTLRDTVIQEQTGNDKSPKNGLFTEAEVMEIIPDYHAQNGNESPNTERDESFDAYTEYVMNNIRYIQDDIAIPVIEESAHDLRAVYETKYKHLTGGESNFTAYTDPQTVFQHVMESGDELVNGVSKEFSNIKGVYIKILPATKMIPIRIDRTIVGYYYISDLTRPDQTGERRNSGLTGYTLRSPSVGYDTYAPDRMFCERLASKIINNFDLKFMRDNAALHEQIVTILEAHRFNDAMMRFIFIPAEHVCQCTINEDGAGKGHSMLEGGLVTARMYMFLKLYSILYQINNAAIRVYNLRQSGIDKNYKQYVQEAIRKFSARRVTTNDIFNYRSSMTKVSGGSELILVAGKDGNPAVNIENIPPVEAPLNDNLMDNQRAEMLNSTPVPSILVQNGGVTEIEFSKETELANTRFKSFVSSCKLDFNRDITTMYRVIMRWETDIAEDILRSLKFAFKMPTEKELTVTVEKLNNFNAVFELAFQTFLTSEEQKNGTNDVDQTSPLARELKKQLIAKYMPDLDVDELEELTNMARTISNKERMKKTAPEENIADIEG